MPAECVVQAEGTVAAVPGNAVELRLGCLCESDICLANPLRSSWTGSTTGV